MSTSSLLSIFKRRKKIDSSFFKLLRVLYLAVVSVDDVSKKRNVSIGRKKTSINRTKTETTKSIKGSLKSIHICVNAIHHDGTSYFYPSYKGTLNGKNGGTRKYPAGKANY